MLHDHIFDFVRIDVKTRHQDHIFFAIDDAQEPLFIHHRDIPGVQPAVFDNLIRRVRALPVAQHHLRPFNTELARLTRRHFVIIIIHQFGFGGGHRQANAAAVVVNIVRVNADQRGTLCQAVALQQILPGQFYPALGHRLLHRHPTAGGQMQRGEIKLLELFVVQQGVEQGVDPGHGGKRILRQLLHQPGDIAWVGDQQILPAQFDKQQAVHGQGENVIQRQRGHHELFAAMQQRAVGGIDLLEVSQHIAVGEHRTFGHAGGAPGVLQKRQIFRNDLRLDVLHAIAVLQRAAKRDGVRQMVLRHQALNVLDHKVHQRTFGGGKLVAHARQDHMLDLSFRHHFFQGMGKVGDYDDRRRAAVVELMLQFTRGI